jgi:hypothetical protein
MKNLRAPLITAAALCVTGLSFNAFAAMEPQVERTLVAVCKAGISNSVYQFNNTMKDYRIDESRIFPRLVCNGEDFHSFALTHGANKTAAKIERYMIGRVTIKDIAMNSGDELLYVNF